MTSFPLKFEWFFIPVQIAHNKHTHKLAFHHISEVKRKYKEKIREINMETYKLVHCINYQYTTISFNSKEGNSFLLNQLQSEFAKITRGRYCGTFTNYIASWTENKKIDLRI